MNQRTSVAPLVPALDAELAAQVAAELAPTELSAERRDRLRECVLVRARDIAPPGTSTVRDDQGQWQRLSDKIELKLLRVDAKAGNQTLLMRVAPGGFLPPHVHEHEEEFFVLEGECHIGNHQLFAGDAHFAAAGSRHETITTRSGVTVLLRTDYPAQLPG